MESPIGELTLNLLLVLFLVFLNGFFVAAEFSLVKVRQTRLAQLVSEGNHKSARYAQTVTQQLDAYLSACQLGITLASLGLGWVGEPAIAHYVEPMMAFFHLPLYLEGPISLAIAFAIITFLHIVLGELAPKSLAIQKAEATSLWTAGPLMFFYKISYPLIWLLNGAANLFIRRLGIEPASENESAHTEEEIRLLVTQSHKSGHIDQTELALVDNVFEFSERLAREIMIPRIDMICLYDDNTFDENLEIMRDSRHSRFPVAHEDKDRLIGFVHTSDFYLSALTTGKAELKDFLRPLLTVPESMEISHVLRLMQKRRSQLAIVIDEYGGTAGILTMEDILEEIVGDIKDEFDDNERPEIEESSNNELSVSGKTLLTELNDYITIEVVSDEVDTIAGWLYSQLNEEVGHGKAVLYQGYRFTISELENHRITRVGISYVGEEESAAHPEDNVLLHAQS
ncbi:hemolysin family protein [Brevibacillus centrosporus]|uniref:hemolysin family protein n=1 Tax=Brevibacillus centrosporus TaxID=54910 RepID=UPI000F0A6796|nr:hemolysin family protein [Brevibacillus centrosporus]MEC2131910.1 hemolysin family protein [Brevibacillus centrosporus]RNB64025.1 HlyC/CorC family transporter [Brevibacillus centrosporus]GED34185.1 membrane protein [Brevibacillus centrosporus]